MSEGDDERRRRARETLARLEGEQGGPLAPSAGAARAENPDEPQDSDEAHDPAVVWGKRVGRALGVALFIALAYNLFGHWLF